MEKAMDLLKCPLCGGMITEKDMNRRRGTAECPDCGVFTTIRGLNKSYTPNARPEAPLPSGFSTIEADSWFKITHTWLPGGTCFGIVVTILVIGALAWWQWSTLKEGGIIRALWLAVMAAIGYYGLALTLNRTDITVDSNTLNVRHGPVPWPGNRTIRTAAVRQLYCKKVTHRRKSKWGNESFHYTYNVMLLTQRRTVPLVKRLGSMDEAVFIEQSIEKYLGITDIPVRDDD
jgi:hypothetical protein